MFEQKAISRDYEWRSPDEFMRERQNKLRAFVEHNNLESKLYAMKGKKVLLLDFKDVGKIDDRKIATYIGQHILAEKKGIAQNCFSIANDAVRANRATGRLSAYSGTSDFVGLGSHCINFDEQRDGTVVAFDLTASKNTDRNQGNFDVLALRAKTLDELLAELNGLYGGDWQVIQID